MRGGHTAALIVLIAAGASSARAGTLVVGPSSFDFMSVVGNSSPWQGVSIGNQSSTSSLEVTSIQFSTPLCSQTSGPQPPFTVGAGIVKSVSFACTPDQLGANDWTMMISTSDGVVVLDIHCMASVRFEVAPLVGDFDLTPLGVSRSLSIVPKVNGNNSSVSISSATISGADAADFSFLSDLPVVVSVNTPTYLGVQFKPSREGTATAQLELETGDQWTPMVVVPLQGVGYVPAFTVTPNPIDLGDIPVGFLAQTTAKIANTGTTDFVADFSVSGSFVVEAPRPIAIPPGGTRNLTIRINALDLGPRSGVLRLHVADPPLPIPITANVVVPDVEVTPSALDLGTWSRGETATTAELVVTNHSAQSVSIQRVATTNLAFTVEASREGLTIPPGESLTFYVSFSRPVVGPTTGEIHVSIAGYDDVIAIVDVTANVVDSGGTGCRATRDGAHPLSAGLFAAIVVPLLRRRSRTRDRR